MTFNTLNPVPSADPRDLDDNAQALDRFLQSTADSEPDRLGVLRRTWKYFETAADALVSPNVTALANLVGAADRLPYFTGAGALSLAVLTAAGRTLLAATTQASQRTALGLGTAATLAAGVANGVATLGADGLLPVSQLPPLAINSTFTVASQAAMLALTAERCDVAIRTDLNGAAYLLTADAPATLANWVAIQQNLGVALTALGAVTPAADRLPYFNGTATAALATFSAFARTLLDDPDQATALSTLGAAPLLSPNFTGTPSAPTPAVGTNSTQLATTAMIQAEIANKRPWTSWTPTITALSGSFTTVATSGKYMAAFGICHFQLALTFTSKGTGTFPSFTLPLTALSGSAGVAQFPLHEGGGVNSKTGLAILTSPTVARISDYAGAEIVTADGCVIQISGSYPIA